MKSISFDCSVIHPLFELASSFTSIDEFSGNVFLFDTNHFLDKLDYCKTLLNQQDVAYASKMRMEKDVNHKIISRTILKLLLSKVLSVPINAIEIEKDKFGKPFAKALILKNIHFSISDSSSIVSIAIGKSLIGVDLEIIQPQFQFQDIVTTHFHENELHQLNASLNKVSNFYLFWTRKESFLKLIGEGLNDQLAQLDMTDGAKLAIIQPINQQEQFFINSFYVNNTLVASISVPQTIKQLRFFNYIATDLV